MTRFLFPMACLPAPQGGFNVILDMIDVLSQAGYPAHVVYPTARYSYRFYSTPTESFCDRRLGPVWARGGWRRKLKLKSPFASAPAVNGPLVLRDDDVIVMPEMRFPELAALYTENRKICLVQIVTTFASAVCRAENEKLRDTDRISYIATSKICADAVRTFVNREPKKVVLRVGGAETGFVRAKKRKIAYMSRKLKSHVGMIIPALSRSAEAAGYEFVELSGLSHSDVMRELGESLVFLSFSSEEGFGLPPAEAMAMGCIVIGYTGVGGDEYFTKNTGFPIQAADIGRFVETARRVLRQYDVDPKPMDEMRLRASEAVITRYSEARFRQSTLNAFEKVDIERVRT